MKINADRSVAGFTLENSGKQSKNTREAASTSSAVSNTALTGDDVELSYRPTTSAESVRDTNIASSSSSAPSSNDLASIRQLVSSTMNSMLANPSAAISAYANLTSESVVGLIG